MQNTSNQPIDTYVLEGQAWIGKDLNKFWLKTDVKYVDGKTEEAEIQALYSRVIAPYWDLQIGLRQDLKLEATREWGVIGIEGLAPYFFEINAALFVGESGATAARISAEYEWMFTQKLVLSPEISLNFYGQNDSETADFVREHDEEISDAQAVVGVRIWF
ncbi:copper resistance protein B [Cellvibrio sp. NN19]|uniref:copper resistance protein B n=1 Tax=Cellvibrio chitinivorans TaxID=3102792 RepID=UPI002B40CE20|nr:copper resistance protein B [Cellvibrio sp. NN19]